MICTPALAARPPSEIALDANRRPGQLLPLLMVQPGQRVLDFVAGAGYYTRLLAEEVGPTGVVFAHSTEGLLVVDGLQPRWAAVKRDHPNVRLILGIPGKMQLPQRLDRVLMHLTFHDLWWESAEYRIPRMEPQRFLAQLHTAVVPGGLVLVVDHRADAGADPRVETGARHRIDPAVVRTMMQGAGFVEDASADFLANPADNHQRHVYDPALRGSTDRFILRFRRP